MVRRWSIVVSLGLTIFVAGCTTQDPAPGGSTSSTPAPNAGLATTSTAPESPGPASSTTTQAAPTVAVTPAADATGVRPDQPVVVKALEGATISAVTVTDADGGTIPGSVKDGVWTSTANLAPATKYTVSATTQGSAGQQTATSTFTTLRPAVDATYHLLYNGQTVGVGAPVTIQFDSPVATKEMRQKIEKHATVTTTPAVAGSWGWLDNRQLMWRPAHFWKPGTKVNLKADLRGLQTGESKWISKGGSSSFSIGDEMISTVDIPGHTMTVTRNGQVVQTFAISAGSGKEPRFVTRSGTKVIIERNGDMTMDSETVGIKKGDPNYYKVETKNNLRVTWTGEFLHSAPWSVGSQGSANVSHGCVNMGPKDSKWMFDNSRVGDVVKFTGSNRPFEPTEGIGVWQYSFADWKKQSAFAK